MSEDDYLVEKVKKQFGLVPEPRVSIRLDTYSNLMREVGRLEGILFGLGSYLQTVVGEVEFGNKVLVESDKVERRLGYLLNES